MRSPNVFLLLAFLLLSFGVLCAQTATQLYATDGSEFFSLDLDIDSEGNKIIVGQLSHRGTHDFDPTNKVFTLPAPSEVAGLTGFIASYNTKGELNFAIQVSDEEIAPFVNILLVETDADNNIYVMGNFRGKADLDPGPEVFELRAPSVFELRSFLASYDQAGNFRFAIQFPTFINLAENSFINNNIINKALSVDDQGNSYLVVKAPGSLDFDPGPGEFIIPFGSAVFSYNSEGELRFGHQVLSGTKDIGCDPDGNYYVTGAINSPSIDETIDLDPGSDTLLLDSLVSNSWYFASYSSEGNLRSAEVVYGSALPMIITGDGSGNLYIAGKMSGAIDFDPGPGEEVLEASEFEPDLAGDIFVARYNSSGELQMARVMEDQVGELSSETILDFEVDLAGNMIMVGKLQNGSVDFDPSDEILEVNASLNPDLTTLFVASYDQEGRLNFAYGNEEATLPFFSVEIDPNCPNYSLSGALEGNGFVDFDPGPDSLKIGASEDLFRPVTLFIANYNRPDVTIPEGCELETEAVTSNRELDHTADIQVFPNPFSDQILIETSNLSDFSALRVFDLFGRVVAEIRITGEQVRLDLADLESGPYFLQLIGPNTRRSITVVKN